MLTFKQYMICESASERKIQKGFSDPPTQIDGAEVVHHDPASETTVYHVKHPKGAYALGSRTGWCTATPQKSFAHEYLRRGNLFTILKGNRRFNYHIEHGFPYDEEFRDEENKRASVDNVIPDHVASNIEDIPPHRFEEKWKKPPNRFENMSQKQAIKNIKDLDTNDRLSVFKTIAEGPRAHTSNTGSLSLEDHEAIANKMNAGDLHHFHDDPEHARYIASNAADTDKIAARMKDHPDPVVQGIVRQRVALAGGEKALISQRPEPEPISNDPNQFRLKFPTVKKKA
jgi:hypothetical protein